MNKFELYCMIYYALDAEWEKCKNVQLGAFLSGANPFLFEDIGSADPSIYIDFCKKVPDTILVEDSYEYAKDYIESLNEVALSVAFLTVNTTEWFECVKEFLSQEHKGNSI